MEMAEYRPPPHEIPGHEASDASIRPIVITGAVLAVVTALAGLVVYGIFVYLAATPATTALPNPMGSTESQIPPAPRLQVQPTSELDQLHAEEDHILSTYGWVDQAAGVVRIPIERAMQLQSERGFPVRGNDVPGNNARANDGRGNSTSGNNARGNERKKP